MARLKEKDYQVSIMHLEEVTEGMLEGATQLKKRQPAKKIKTEYLQELLSTCIELRKAADTLCQQLSLAIDFRTGNHD